MKATLCEVFRLFISGAEAGAAGAEACCAAFAGAAGELAGVFAGAAGGAGFGACCFTPFITAEFCAGGGAAAPAEGFVLGVPACGTCAFEPVPFCTAGILPLGAGPAGACGAGAAFG